MSLKRKVISAVTALSMSASAMATMAPSVSAVQSTKYKINTDVTYGRQYYKDGNSVRIYDGFIIDRSGNVYYASDNSYYINTYNENAIITNKNFKHTKDELQVMLGLNQGVVYDINGNIINNNGYNNQLVNGYFYDNNGQLRNSSNRKVSYYTDNQGNLRDSSNGTVIQYGNSYVNSNNDSYYYDNYGQLRNASNGSIVNYYTDNNGYMRDSLTGNIIQNINSYSNNVGSINDGGFVNIDIDDPEVLERHMQYRDGQLYYGNTQINNHSQEFASQFPDNGYNDYNAGNGTLYTVVKSENGVTKYAYSPVADVEQFGLYGWRLNSIYNSNDYELNSVFYEEINTFGNDYRWNNDIVNRINIIQNLYIWRYYTPEGTKYCVSTLRTPASADFEFNSKFNINDVNVALKSAEAAANEKAWIRGLYR